MDTSKIVFASALHAIADRSVEMRQRLFEIEFIQPFIDKAASECSLAAQKGLYSWYTEYMTFLDEKKEWFQTAISQAFKSMGYTVGYIYKGHKCSDTFAVLIEW